MPSEIVTGITAAAHLLFPVRPLAGYVTLSLLVLVYSYLLFRFRNDFARLSLKRWGAMVLLALSAILLSQTALPWPLDGFFTSDTGTFFPLIFSAILLAGATLGSGAALVVGFVGGLGHALWQSHNIYDPFLFAFMGALYGAFLYQQYPGAAYRWLRKPFVAGIFSPLLLSILLIPAYYPYTFPDLTTLAALDHTLALFGSALVLLLVSAILSSLVVAVILLGIPRWRLTTAYRLHPKPIQSIRSRLMADFALLSITTGLLALAIIYSLTFTIARRIVVEQMALKSQAISAGIPEFRDQLLAFQDMQDEGDLLLSSDGATLQEKLSEAIGTGRVFQQVILVVGETTMLSYPPGDQAVVLTPAEQSAIRDALTGREPVMVTTAPAVPAPLSIVLPLSEEGDQRSLALVGRIPSNTVDDLLLGLSAAEEQGQARIVDERGRVIAQSGSEALSLGEVGSPDDALKPPAPVEGDSNLVCDTRASATAGRQLVCHLKSADHPWAVTYTLPHDAVLRYAVRIGAPLIGILLLVMGAFAVNMLFASRSVTQPLRTLVDASQMVAGGSLNEPIPVTSEDEIGQLGTALESVRVSMRDRLSELSLLLQVSQQVSASLNIQDGMPAILEGAQRGGGAAGARAVVLNPSGRYPLTFGAGEAADTMRLLDRRLASMVRSEELVLLQNAGEVREKFGAPEDAKLPVQALAAIAVYSQQRFLGVLWIGYDQPHQFTSQELGLLRTLAGQAAGLVENARLFSTAEGGRRRLAAVLASTADAVIVTDQTERILLINPAMERLFQLQASEVVSRPVTDVVQSEILLEALLNEGKRPRHVEIALEDGRTLLINASTIFSRDGQVMGRVAVLHDVSQLKKIDELKSEFVATVSHDLRGPLTYMTGYAAMLPLVGDLNSDQKAYLTRIQSGIEQMTDLVEDLLDLRRLEAGRVVAKDTIVARDLLYQVANDHAEPARRQGIRFHVQVAPNVPAIRGDIILVQRALVNLVDNAIKYAPRSGVVMLTAVHEGGEVIFSVQDRGPGIAREDQLRLFETFYQVKQSGDEEKKGYGLGLAIVKSIAEHHGGRVWFVSLPGIGSTFYLALPANGRDPR